MRHRMAIAVLAGFAAMAGTAAAATVVESSNGVTVIRNSGSAATAPNEAAPAARSGSTVPPPAVTNRTGAVSAVHTGSENAGGISGSPPPGAGQ